MEVLYSHCAGLDVHKKTVVVCRLGVDAKGHKVKSVETFGTTTAELLRVSDWLTAGECTHVAMESTGEFWKPIWNLLEGNFELLLVNAQHVKRVPGRKTDVQDAEWLADLLQHGLLKASFIPPVEQRDRRDLTRQRTQLVRDRASVLNRIQKVLEGANIKLSSVVSEISGVSSRAILAELVADHLNPAQLEGLVHGRLRDKLPELEQALSGRVRPHHRFLLAQHLAHLDFLDEQIAAYSREIENLTAPFDELVALLDTIPGVARTTAELILAEVGADLSRFPTADHLASWAGLVPGNNESAGKRLSGKTRTRHARGASVRQGSQWLRAGLTQAAHAAARQKNNYLAAHYHRLAGRRGKKRATMAVAHSILVIAYHIIQDRKPYQDLGSNYFDERQKSFTANRLTRRLEKLGYHVLITPPATSVAA
jgi:transposase